MQINKTSFVAGIGSAVLLGAALVPAWAAAQTGEDDPTPSATATATAEDGSSEGGSTDGEAKECGPGFGFAVRVHGSEALADALGVTAEELDAALETARESLGEVERPTTEEEAEALRAEYRDAIAEALGITVEELEAAQTEVREAREAEAIARVQEQVAEGNLSQEEADAIIERIQSDEGLLGPELRRHRSPRGGGWLERGHSEGGFPFGGSFFFGAPDVDDDQESVTPDL